MQKVDYRLFVINLKRMNRKCNKSFHAVRKEITMRREKVSENNKLLNEWDYERNTAEKLFPEEITCGSHKEVNWRCSTCGHRWKAHVNKRAAGRRCPVCSAKQKRLKLIKKNTLVGENDIKTMFPTLADEWEQQEDGLTPSDVTTQSNVEVQWKCSICGGMWKTSVYARTQGNGCPYCQKRVLVCGENDLASQFPEVAKEWDNTRNTKKAHEVFAKSSQKAFWVCSKCGHKWKACIENRTRNNTGCPKCAGQKKREIDIKLNYI